MQTECQKYSLQRWDIDMDLDKKWKNYLKWNVYALFQYDNDTLR